MKRIFLLLALGLSVQTQAQYKYYRDSSFVTTFNYLSGANSVNNGQFWDDDNFTIPVGFWFKFFQDSLNTLYLDASLGSGVALFKAPITISTSHVSGIVPHFSDLQDRDTSMSGSFSPISYALSGSAPNRIFKMEWRNAGFFNAIDNGVYDDSVSFQLWLHEGSNLIDVVFGPGNYVSPSTDLYDGSAGPRISIFDSINVADLTGKNIYFFTGPHDNPTLDSLDDITAIPVTACVTGHPASGRVYRFIPYTDPVIGVGYTTYTETKDHDIRHYAGSGQLTVDIFTATTWKAHILDANGRLIQNLTLNPGSQQIAVNQLPEGMYFMVLENKGKTYTYRFIP